VDKLCRRLVEFTTFLDDVCMAKITDAVNRLCSG